MFFDEARIVVRAGHGGDGCVSFRREKYVSQGGPDGGHGGKGGDVYLRVNPQRNTLVHFTKRGHFQAEDGRNGSGKGQRGRSGSDLYVDVPAGTIVRDADSGRVLGDLTKEDEALLVVEGGRGGRGNEAFKSATKRTPRFAEKGLPGEERALELELKLIADVGLVGKPNAGKSTLLATVSAARPKIAAYPFTTLQPHLGVVEIDQRTFVMADIPGLIEGAHEGVGLGIEFLRHVERTRLLVHLLDGSSLDPAGDLAAINEELALYSQKLRRKPQIVVLNKMDLPSAQAHYERLKAELDVPVYAISAVTRQGVQDLLRLLADRLSELPEEEQETAEEELFVFRPHEEMIAQAFEVRREASDTYRVVGDEVEALVEMTDWSNIYAMERFERLMVARGISEALEQAGVRQGDTVLIGDMELEWQ